MMNTIILNSLYSQMNHSELYHHGILGMHWGIRRFQPYGQGYDPKNEGKETGLAARLAGQTNSYSNLYGRGSNKARAKQYAKQLGSRAKSGINEALERLNYANDRLGKGIKDAGKKAKAGLAKYAAGYDTDLDARRAYESASASDLARGVLSTFGSRAKTKVSDLKRTSWDDVRSAMGDGASRFQESMAKTKIASKQFSANAQTTMALLRGAMDSRSSASQIIEGRTPGGSKKVMGASRKDYDGFTGLNDPRLRSLDEYRDYRNMPTSAVGAQLKRQSTYREDSIKQLTNGSWSAPTTYDRRIPNSFMSTKELDRARNKMLTTMDAPISELSAPLDLRLMSADRPHLYRDPYMSDQTATMLNRIKLDEIQKRSSSTDIGKRLLGL